MSGDSSIQHFVPLTFQPFVRAWQAQKCMFTPFAPENEWQLVEGQDTFYRLWVSASNQACDCKGRWDIATYRGPQAARDFSIDSVLKTEHQNKNKDCSPQEGIFQSFFYQWNRPPYSKKETFEIMSINNLSKTFFSLPCIPNYLRHLINKSTTSAAT